MATSLRFKETLFVLALTFAFSVLTFAPASRAQSQEGARIQTPKDESSEVETLLRRHRLERREMLRQLRERDEQPTTNGQFSLQSQPQVNAALDYPTVEPEQAYVLNDNPTPRLNFDLTGTPQFAGDVNGDGTNDYLYAERGIFGTPRDERTTDVLEDVVGKTALFLGGNSSETEDQFFYRSLRPAGDLNSDGFDDAIEYSTERDEIAVYTGSPSGYTYSNVTLPRITGGKTTGFSDIDGDGNEDVFFGGSDNFGVIYGANDVGNVSLERYSVDSPARFDNSTSNIADLNGDGKPSIVRLVGFSGFDDQNIYVEIFDVDPADRSLNRIQSFEAEDLEGGADRNQLSLIDINGDGIREIAVRSESGSGNPTYVFVKRSDGLYQEAPITLSSANGVVPVGDLDSDGRHDFYLEEGGVSYIAFGPSDLQSGLTERVEVSASQDENYGAGFVPYGGLGDLDGDGIDDAVLDYTSDGLVGRAFLYGSQDRSSLTSSETVSYQRERFFDAIASTNNVGDLNGDGVDDFTIVRSGLGQVEVFFGGEDVSGAPDLTVEAPGGLTPLWTTGGDFDGDGSSDLVVTYSTGAQADVYLGGESFDVQPDHVIEPGDFIAEDYGVYAGRNIGDLDSDGTDDLFFTTAGLAGTARGFVFLGASDLPSQPTATIDFSNGVENPYFAGITATEVADMNGDGFGDFAVALPNTQNANGTTGSAYVYFGSNSPSFENPDRVLKPELPEDEGDRYFADALASGDFNGDGYADIAAKPTSSFNSDADLSINVYYGGESVDEQADQRLFIPSDAIGRGSSFRENSYFSLGELSSVPSGGSDALLLGTAVLTNALLYQPGTGDGGPTKVLRAPNQDASLGAIYYLNAAVGYFDGDKSVDVVLTQRNDNNDAAQSSRVYRYGLEPDETPPTAPSEVRAVAGAGQVTLTWTAGTEADLEAFDIYRGQSAGFDTTGAQVARLPADSTRYVDQELIGGSTYYYHVVATDETGNTSALSRVTSATPEDVTAPAAPTELTASAQEEAIELTWTTSTSEDADQTLVYRSTPDSGEELLATLEEAGTTTYTDASAETGTRYYYRLKARDAAGNESDFSASASAFLAPAEVSYNVSRSFGGADETSDYRLVALPGIESVPLEDVLEGEFGAEWKAFRQSESGSGLVSYRETDGNGFAFGPGGGFWVVAREGLERSAEPPAPQVGQDGTYALVLHEGWNIISNPFGERSFDWSAVQAANEGASQPLWSFAGGSYEQVEIFAPAGEEGRAYYFYNQTGLSELVLPYAPDSSPGNEATPARLASKSSAQAAPDDEEASQEWSVTLTAERTVSSSARPEGDASKRFTATARAGASEEAKAGLDPRDVLAPPGRFETVSLGISPEAGDASTEGRLPELAAEYRPKRTANGNAGERFALNLRSALGEEVVLHVEGLASLPSGQEALLIRRATGEHFELSGETIHLTPEAETESLTLIVGTRGFVEEAAQEVAPDEPALVGTYPNPFRGRATIAYNVSEESEVRLVIYDMLGRKVRTLIDETQSSGRKKAILQAPSLSSGVYVFRLKIGDHIETGRLVHVR